MHVHQIGDRFVVERLSRVGCKMFVSGVEEEGESSEVAVA